MSKIKIHDKVFKPFLSNEFIEESITRLATRMNNELKDVESPLFISVLNGSFMFTASLMQKLDFQPELSFIRVSSYMGTESSGKIDQVMSLNRDLSGRNVIIVEDIVDTGNTISWLHKTATEANSKSVRICTLLLKPEAYKGDITIDYAAIEIPNDFIVGFGLDYNELGRNYKDIYVLDQ